MNTEEIKNIYGSYLEYSVILEQNGTNAPTVVQTLFDNLSSAVGGITYSYASTGEYELSRGDSNPWSAEKTYVMIGSGNDRYILPFAAYAAGLPKMRIGVYDCDAGVAVDDGMTFTTFVIRVYA